MEGYLIRNFRDLLEEMRRSIIISIKTSKNWSRLKKQEKSSKRSLNPAGGGGFTLKLIY